MEEAAKTQDSHPAKPPAGAGRSLANASLWLVVSAALLLRSLLRAADRVAAHQPLTVWLLLQILLWAGGLAWWTWLGGAALSRYRSHR